MEFAKAGSFRWSGFVVGLAALNAQARDIGLLWGAALARPCEERLAEIDSIIERSADWNPQVGSEEPKTGGIKHAG